ncbi:MAG: hypothetical protein H6708_21870 [Kofleriaceae bacterium]|nr:hypothetical protein [Kofleriaceae bacterium]
MPQQRGGGEPGPEAGGVAAGGLGEPSQDAVVGGAAGAALERAEVAPRRGLGGAGGIGLDQGGAARHQLEDAGVAAGERGVEADVDQAQPVGHRGGAAGPLDGAIAAGERRGDQLERGAGLVLAVEEQRRGVGDLVGRRLRRARRLGGRRGGRVPVAGEAVAQRGQVAQLGDQLAVAAGLDAAGRGGSGAARVADAVQPGLGEIAQQHQALAGVGDVLDQTLGALDRDDVVVEQRVRQGQPHRQRVALGELEVARRVLLVLEDVPGDQRQPQVEIGEPLVGVLAAR